VRSAVDGAGRNAGLIVFLLGVLLLVAVFYFAYLELLASGNLTSTANQGVLLLVAAKGLFLFLMGFVASAIANKGIGLYQAAVHAEE
jgi:hypothetical protein